MQETVVGFSSEADDEGNIATYSASFIETEDGPRLRVFRDDAFVDYSIDEAISHGTIFVDVSEREADMFRKFFNILG
jgi:hypothetical protein